MGPESTYNPFDSISTTTTDSTVNSTNNPTSRLATRVSNTYDKLNSLFDKAKSITNPTVTMDTQVSFNYTKIIMVVALVFIMFKLFFKK